MAEHARLFMHLTSADTGMIKGEATVMARRDWINIDNWSWSMNRDVKSAGADTVEPGKLTFSKLMDRASPYMLRAMQLGSVMNATIKMEDSSLQAVRLEVQIKSLRIISYDLKAQDNNKLTTIEENWAFDYEAVVFEYQPNAATGAMKVRLERRIGASLDSRDEPLSKFLALSKDMSVKDLDDLWNDLRPQHEQQLKKIGQSEKEKLSNTKSKDGNK